MNTTKLASLSAMVLAFGLGGAARAEETGAHAQPEAKASSGAWGDAPTREEGAQPAEGFEGWSDGKIAPVRSPTDPDATDPRFIKPGRFGPVALASTLPAVLFAYVPSYAFVLGGGLGFVYDANGIPGPTGPTPDRFSGNIILLAEYMVINEGPFAFGPEVFFTGSIAPGGFLSRKSISPGICWWYAPWWNSPVLIGGAWHAKVDIIHGLGTIVSLQTPSVRFGFLWK